MPHIIIRSRSYRQPPILPGFDLANPLCRELSGALTNLNGWPSLLANGERPTSHTGTLAHGSSGRGIAYSSGSNQETIFSRNTIRLPGAGTGITIVTLLDVGTLQNYSGIVFAQNSSVNVGFELRLGNGPSGSDVLFMRANSQNNIFENTGGNRLSNGDKSVVLIVSAAASMNSPAQFWVNGIKYTGAGGGVAQDFTVTTTGDLRFATRFDAAVKFDGIIYLCALWRRTITDLEAQQLTRNPWEIFQPIERKIFFDIGSGGAIPVTLTTSLNAAVQAALQATATLSAGIQVSDTRTATLDSALEFAVAATSTLQAAIQAAISANATLDGYVQAGSELSSTLDAGIQDSKTGTTSLNAAIEASQSATATLAAAIEVARAATATLDAAVAASALATSTLDAFIQAGTQLVATVDAAVQFAATASATLSAAIAELRTGSSTLDAVLVTLGSVAATLDAAILSTRVATATLNAYIEDVTAVEPRGSRYRVGRRPGYVVRG